MSFDRIIFLHIPKTAGTSIRSAFERVLDDDQILSLYPATEWAHDPDDLAGIPLEVRARSRLVIGHVKFGIAEHFPGRSVYATVLRDPVDRVLSSYYLHERAIENDGPRNDLQRAIAAGEIDLRAFAENPGNRNVQTRFVAGLGVTGRRALEQALENLASDFLAAGTTDRSDRFVDALVTAAAWGRTPRVKRLNANKQRPATHEEPAELLQHIAGLNELDAELLSHVKALTKNGKSPILKSAPRPRG